MFMNPGKASSGRDCGRFPVTASNISPISVKIVMYHYGMISSQLSQLSGSRCSRWLKSDQLDAFDRVVVGSNEMVDVNVLHKSQISRNTNHV